MADPLVVVEDLHKTFVHMGRELHVLRGIDLVIEQGDVMAIVGASGAGKSTFLHCIGTLDLPTRGRIRLGRDELTGLSGNKLAAIRNKTIGFVFQFHHLLPEFNALENVMMPGLIQGKSRQEMEGPARALLGEVGLGERVTHRPGELSGGEQQRVALARALVLSPKLILADEPTGNLDSATSEAMHTLFFEINKRHGTTIVVVTHNPAFAKAMPRVVTMLDGKVDTDERRAVPGKGVAPAPAGMLVDEARAILDVELSKAVASPADTKPRDAAAADDNGQPPPPADPERDQDEAVAAKAAEAPEARK